MATEEEIRSAQEAFGELIRADAGRIERMRNAGPPKDFASLDHVVVGVLPGDGIGPLIMEQGLRVMRTLVADEIAAGKIEIRVIEGMTIERRAELNESLPADVLEACKECDVLIKGPLVTPRAGDPWPNLVSANSLLRRGLDLYAAARPIRIPDKGIDWMFFRENIEGEYLWGNKGIRVNDDVCVDFKVLSDLEAERIARMAFEYAKNNGKTNVTVVTKANIVKLVDGNFVQAVEKMADNYPDITVQSRFVDAMAAKMMDPEFTEGMQVFVLPNLYGDIVTDVAAEHMGGLGMACSSNLGDHHALFEAIHGTAPNLMRAGLGDYANPCSLIRAAGMLLGHVGYADRNARLTEALDEMLADPEAPVAAPGKQTIGEFTDELLQRLAEK